ncbi:MAG: hypothetical protein JWP12_2300 [Bacteroidetes bacterium]|nr:hypothetical protein [Bacteroidota bacterium]
MKKTGLILIVCLYTGLAFTSCTGSNKKTDNKETQEVKSQYQCPMKCTEEKFDKPGKCPVCGMELEKVANS